MAKLNKKVAAPDNMVSPGAIAAARQRLADPGAGRAKLFSRAKPKAPTKPAKPELTAEQQDDVADLLDTLNGYDPAVVEAAIEQWQQDQESESEKANVPEPEEPS